MKGSAKEQKRPWKLREARITIRIGIIGIGFMGKRHFETYAKVEERG